MKPWLQTYTGLAMEPLDPKPEMIRIEDIAHHLSLQCRYAGATPFPYSVAQHSLLVAAIVERHCTMTGCGEVDPSDCDGSCDGRLLPLVALLHDAAEAYLVDLPKPLKDHPEFGVGYKAVERRLEEVIEERFGLPVGILNHPVVRDADGRAFATEVRDFGMLAKAPREWSYVPEPWPVSAVSGADAERDAVLAERWRRERLFVNSVCDTLVPVRAWNWRDVELAFLAEFDRLGGKR